MALRSETEFAWMSAQRPLEVSTAPKECTQGVYARERGALHTCSPIIVTVDRDVFNICIFRARRDSHRDDAYS